jgi:competence protein ComEC
MQRSSRYIVLALAILALVVGIIWYAVYAESRRGMLTVSFLDVGQGDAIFIDAPSGRQVLVDGGKSAQVLRALGDVMPWYDRSIDFIVATHPDADHIGGLVDVLGRYRVRAVLEPSVRDNDGSDSRALERALLAEGSVRTMAARGQVLELGGGAYFEILFPDREVPRLESNAGSIIMRLVYGDTSVLLTGDAPDEIEEYLVALDGERLRSTVLKVGHHGSKTSSSPLFLGYVDPEYAVVSRGCDNSYGHPAPEVVARYETFGIPTLDTCADGAITFESDGTTMEQK